MCWSSCSLRHSGVSLCKRFAQLRRHALVTTKKTTRTTKEMYTETLSMTMPQLSNKHHKSQTHSGTTPCLNSTVSCILNDLTAPSAACHKPSATRNFVTLQTGSSHSNRHCVTSLHHLRFLQHLSRTQNYLQSFVPFFIVPIAEAWFVLACQDMMVPSAKSGTLFHQHLCLVQPQPSPCHPTDRHAL